MKPTRTNLVSSLLAAAVCTVAPWAGASETVCLSLTSNLAGHPSYFDATIGGQLYDTWCVDTDLSIDRNRTYTGRVYPFGDPIMAQFFDRPDAVQNLDLVLYIINQRYPGKMSVSNGIFTLGDVQRAIWQLLEDVQSNSLIFPWSQLRVDEILALAQANGEGFVPGCGETTVSFVQPVLAGTCDLNTALQTAVAQILIVEHPVQCASIGDRVWYDTNANGVQDQGEAGVPGLGVQLLDCQDNVLADAQTDANGNYLFSSLTPGSYRILVQLPAGYSFSPQDIGADDGADSDADAAGYMACTTLSPGENDLSWDAGLVLLRASIGDFVWFDANKNGVQDNGETGIAGVTVDLLDCGGNALATTQTDGQGYYSFNGLMPADYAIRVTAPGGYAFSPQGQGGDAALDSDSDSNGNMVCTTLAPGETDLSWDAGLYQLPASIGDRVWHDINADGIQDANEPGLQGVMVDLMDCNGNIISSMATGLNGAYLFSNLQPGNYNVRIQVPAGYTVSPGNQGGDAGLDSDADAGGAMTCTTLDAGESDLSWDAGIYQLPASIGNFVWVDTNGNGLQDNGEVGLPGVTVRLMDCQGNVLASASTDANGGYLFSNLASGNYNIQIVPPAGYSVTQRDQGGNDGLDSDADASGLMACTALDAGENDDSWDAGLVQEAPCGECEGKVTQLTLRYNGTTAAHIKVLMKRPSTQVFSATVQPGGVFTFNGADDRGTLSTEIYIYVNGVLATSIHTSCSQPIGPGLTKGAFTVMGGYSKNGGKLCPVTTPPPPECSECEGKVTQLTLRYNGDCPALVKVTMKNPSIEIFSATVQPGGLFTLNGADAHGTLGTEIYLCVKGRYATSIHTSCSQPIGPGLTKGPFTVVEGYSKNGGKLCPVKPPTKPDCRDEHDGKGGKGDDDDDDDKGGKGGHGDKDDHDGKGGKGDKDDDDDKGGKGGYGGKDDDDGKGGYGGKDGKSGNKSRGKSSGGYSGRH